MRPDGDGLVQSAHCQQLRNAIRLINWNDSNLICQLRPEESVQQASANKAGYLLQSAQTLHYVHVERLAPIIYIHDYRTKQVLD